MNHTLRPWNLNKNGEPFMVWGDKPGHYSVWSPDEPYMGWSADARLIVKAPDMFELVKWMAEDPMIPVGLQEEARKMVEEIKKP